MPIEWQLYTFTVCVCVSSLCYVTLVTDLQMFLISCHRLKNLTASCTTINVTYTSETQAKNVYITAHKCQLNEHVHESWEGSSTKRYNNRGVHFFKSLKLNRLMNNTTTNNDYKDTFTAWMSVIPGLCFLQQNFRAEIKTSVDNLCSSSNIMPS